MKPPASAKCDMKHVTCDNHDPDLSMIFTQKHGIFFFSVTALGFSISIAIMFGWNAITTSYYIDRGAHFRHSYPSSGLPFWTRSPSCCFLAAAGSHQEPTTEMQLIKPNTATNPLAY